MRLAKEKAMRILPGGPGRPAHLFARYAFSPLFSPVHINVVFAVVIGLVTASCRMKDCMNRTPVTAHPGENRADALRRMRDANREIAPGVDRQAPRRMAGIVTCRHV